MAPVLSCPYKFPSPPTKRPHSHGEQPLSYRLSTFLVPVFWAFSLTRQLIPECICEATLLHLVSACSILTDGNKTRSQPSSRVRARLSYAPAPPPALLSSLHPSGHHKYASARAILLSSNTAFAHVGILEGWSRRSRGMYLQG